MVILHGSGGISASTRRLYSRRRTHHDEIRTGLTEMRFALERIRDMLHAAPWLPRGFPVASP